ncbi:phage tail tape measure protein [Undibacterium squillarum]|uniref:phage tail tape measure protein n=1 Tax=Undibacterium squillarum TaxID=1131567 RepID=UPI0035AF173E
MSERDLKLQVVFSMMEKVTAPLKSIQKATSAAGKEFKELRDKLKSLEAQQRNIANFKQLHATLRETSEKLTSAEHKVGMLAEQMKKVENPTKTMTRELARATEKARQLEAQLYQEGDQLEVLQRKLHDAGIRTSELGQHERSLQSNMAATNSKIKDQTKLLELLTKKQEQANAAKKRMQESQATAGKWAAAGIGMTVAGGAMGVPVIKSVDQAAQFQQQVSRLRALGIGEDMVQEGIQFAKGMNMMGSSSLDNLKLLTEAHSILRDFHHAQEVTPLLAKMKFGIEGVMQQRGGGEGHGEAAENMFRDLIKTAELRGALTDMDTFKRVLDFSTKAYVASGGLVKPGDLLNMIKTGGVAAKQLSDDSFFFGMLHNIQEMGGDRTGTALMSAYQNWAVGRTTQQTAEELHKDGLINPDSIKYGKTGHITKMMPDALKSAEKYKSDPFLYLIEDVLPKIKKEGMTDNQVISKITTLFSSRKAADLMSSMYKERANIEKHRVAAKGAFGIDQLNQESASGVNGQYLDLIAKRNTLEQQLGEQLLPIINTGLKLLIDTLSGLNSFFTQHQTTAKVLTVSFAALAVVLVVLGGLALVLASLIGPFAILRYGMAMLGIQGLGLASMWARLGAVFASAGAALLANPIGLAIAAVALLAAGAYYLYRNWAPATQFFDGIWSRIRQIFASAMAWLSGLPASFSEFGSNMMQGLINGITGAAATVREVISNVADDVVGWFKAKLGIHSPSVVFAELGQFTMQGLSIGLEQGEHQPLKQLSSLTKRMAALGGGLAISAATMPAMATDISQAYARPLTPVTAEAPVFKPLAPVSIDRRPPVATQGSAQPAQHHSTNSIQITINPPAGADPHAIARAVAAELDKRERQRSLAKRSSMHDYDES